MLIHIQRVDIAQLLAQGQRPAAMLRRELIGNDGVQRIVPQSATLATTEPWLILQHELSGEPELRWALDRSSSHVRIPLFPYLVTDSSPEILLHLGLQTGALATASLSRRAAGLAEKLVLVFGNVFQRPDGQPGFQCWIGFAARLKES